MLNERKDRTTLTGSFFHSLVEDPRFRDQLPMILGVFENRSTGMFNIWGGYAFRSDLLHPRMLCLIIGICKQNLVLQIVKCRIDGDPSYDSEYMYVYYIYLRSIDT